MSRFLIPAPMLTIFSVPLLSQTKLLLQGSSIISLKIQTGLQTYTSLPHAPLLFCNLSCLPCFPFYICRQYTFNGQPYPSTFFADLHSPQCWLSTLVSFSIYSAHAHSHFFPRNTSHLFNGHLHIISAH